MSLIKVCAGCGPCNISAFGRNKANFTQGARDGLNIRCRSCIREKTAIQRQVRRRECTKPVMVLRSFSARRIKMRLKKLPPEERVYAAIKLGRHTQREIRYITGLLPDQVPDHLASLLLWRKRIKTAIINGERMYFVRQEKKVERKESVLSPFCEIREIMPRRATA